MKSEIDKAELDITMLVLMDYIESALKRAEKYIKGDASGVKNSLTVQGNVHTYFVNIATAIRALERFAMVEAELPPTCYLVITIGDYKNNLFYLNELVKDIQTGTYDWKQGDC